MRLGKWQLLAVCFVVLVALDQWTKYLAVEHLTSVFGRVGAETTFEKVGIFYRARHLEGLATAPYIVHPAWWRMSYAENPGAAFSMFRNLSPDTRNWFFTAVIVAAVIFIITTYRKAREDQRLLQLALAGVLSGAVGNFIDRLARHYVIDFIEWHWWNRPDIAWPTFNVADSLIVVGVALLILHPGPAKERAPASA
ncbi:MAG: signal peptidase II [Anaeromyxobacteraceae bacterium]